MRVIAGWEERKGRLCSRTSFSLGWPIFRCGGHLDLVGAEICWVYFWILVGHSYGCWSPFPFPGAFGFFKPQVMARLWHMGNIHFLFAWSLSFLLTYCWRSSCHLFGRKYKFLLLIEMEFSADWYTGQSFNTCVVANISDACLSSCQVWCSYVQHCVKSLCDLTLAV